MFERDSHPYEIRSGHICRDGQFRNYQIILCSHGCFKREGCYELRAEYDPLLKKYYFNENRHEQAHDLINSGRAHLLPLDSSKRNINDFNRHDAWWYIKDFWKDFRKMPLLPIRFNVYRKKKDNH